VNAVHKENFRVRLMRNQLRYEKKYRKPMNSILATQEQEALNNLEAFASKGVGNLPPSFNTDIDVVIKASPKFFDDAAADRLMEQKLMPVLINLGEDQGALALIFAGDDEHEFRMTAPYEKLLRQSTQRMAGRFNDDTLNRINRTLAEGIQQGENLSKLRARVEDVYDFKSRVASLRVARTETLKASNNATNEAYRQTGYVKSKEWVVNPGACPECEAFEGKTIPLDDTFLPKGGSYSYTDANGEEQTRDNNYDDVDNPPLHPNCRCTIVPVR
jgi:SPP1 gp7 family putative phage head morphogenesis protein